MVNKCVLFVAVLGMAVFLACGNVPAEENAQAAAAQPEAAVTQKQGSPFLITGTLPHLSKLLITQWENPDLALTEEQRGKLIAIREQTIASVKKFNQEIAELEQSVAQYIFADKTPTDLTPIVQIIAALKTEATLVHLQCIYDTKRVLSEKQLEVLMNL